MVGSTLPRSVSHSVADTAGVASGAGNLKAAIAMRVAGALAPNNPPRGRIGWTSRALVVRVHRSGLMAAHSVPAGDKNNSTDSLSGPPAPVSTSSPSPSPSPTAAATRAPAPVPVLAITCGAVGGVVALAVILALVYVRRVRRRVKSMKRLTNVLGPGALPLSPTQLRAARQHRLSVVHAHLLFWLRTCADVAVPVTIAIDDRLAPCQVRWDARRRPATDGFRSDQSLASAERFVS